jgi:hypothetical protein
MRSDRKVAAMLAFAAHERRAMRDLERRFVPGPAPATAKPPGGIHSRVYGPLRIGIARTHNLKGTRQNVRNSCSFLSS